MADGAMRWPLPRAQFGPLTGNSEFLRRMFASVCRRMRTHNEHVETPVRIVKPTVGAPSAAHGGRAAHAASVPVYGCIRLKQSVLASMVNVTPSQAECPLAPLAA